jgi:hypothetical protein
MMMLTRRNHRSTSPAVATGWTVGFLAMVGLGTFVVMRQRGFACDPQSVAMATLAVMAALVPPLWFDRLNLRVAGPLVTVMWRLGVLLPVIAFTTKQTEPVRNCTQGTLLACYLMTLPLESWLLIRQSSSPRRLKNVELTAEFENAEPSRPSPEIIAPDNASSEQSERPSCDPGANGRGD